jgi:hypothetical protein
MIFWLVSKLDISYRVMIFLKDFGFKIIFLHGKIFEFL